MRAKQVDTSGRLDVGEAVEGGSVRDEAVSAAPLPPEDDEEGQPAQPLARPDRPTPEMVAAHEVSHLPYRSWCRACVAGRGRAFQHKASTQESTVPVVSMDYLYFNERADGSGLPTVVLRDRHSKAIFSHLLPCKGTTGSTHPERAMDLSFLGYKTLVLKNDQAVRNGFTGLRNLRKETTMVRAMVKLNVLSKQCRVWSEPSKLDWRRKASPSSQHLLC